MPKFYFNADSHCFNILSQGFLTCSLHTSKERLLTSSLEEYVNNQIHLCLEILLQRSVTLISLSEGFKSDWLRSTYLYLASLPITHGHMTKAWSESSLALTYEEEEKETFSTGLAKLRLQWPCPLPNGKNESLQNRTNV